VSDTPRTDEQINGKPCTRFEILAGDSLRNAAVPSEFARTLERELNAANQRIKRLEEAGEELRKASRTFLLTHVDDDDGNEDAISIDQVNPESAVQWEDPPSAGEHARLRNAINGWCKAKVQP